MTYPYGYPQYYPPRPAPDNTRSVLQGVLLFLAIIMAVGAIVFAYYRGYNDAIGDVKECITSFAIKCPG